MREHISSLPSMAPLDTVHPEHKKTANRKVGGFLLSVDKSYFKLSI
ncbi:MAG: hypothetical protein ACPGR2_18095 [Psychrobium sp.]